MDLIPDNARVLCLSPHPDDVEFGLGATLNKYRGAYHGLLVVFSDRAETRGELENEGEQRRAAERIGLGPDQVRFVDEIGLEAERLPVRFFATEENRDRIRKVVTELVNDFEPDLIFVPSMHETMQDHQAMGEEVVRVVRGRASILGYEVPRHNRYFRPNVFVKISEADLEAKRAALDCFAEFTNRYYFDADALKALARVRALDAGYSGLAEAFEMYRFFAA